MPVRLLSGLLGQRQEYTCLGAFTRLHMPRVDDFAQWRDLRLSSRRFLEPWEPTWADDELLLSSFRRRISHYNKLAADDQAYPFFITLQKDGTLVGGITISNLRRGVAQMATLGYWVGEAHAGKGVMTDALQTIIDFARDELELHRLEAACLPTNQPSMRLLQKSGFAQEGFAKSYLKINGNWEDHVLWGLNLAR